ncbi:hypothetical protein NECAME_17545 [Necator americanus]|uniref:Uncharacterized protein n=1 Tax=Necator americanus TaxID=51031 RepID=W2TQ86_NECAM|nr:hypothetical protein NECAME_17545 [Necator americanus]ETN83197.1 hypothetical protein NECAME_17545 [Necator americanus]
MSLRRLRSQHQAHHWIHVLTSMWSCPKHASGEDGRTECTAVTTSTPISGTAVSRIPDTVGFGTTISNGYGIFSLFASSIAAHCDIARTLKKGPSSMKRDFSTRNVELRRKRNAVKRTW